ncbi:MAG: polyprenyl synthetase family protein [Desulfobacterales bacterium]|nr:polyprenyl synthetase family protein [Desulfobacterales bacterium]
MPFDLQAYLANHREIINNALTRILDTTGQDNRLIEAMRYSLMANGKRLRPILCMAAAEAVGGPTGAVVPAACALEMIHTYSLIHDDLPAMDNDDLRRGKPTSHVKFNEATAILAGDALLTLAFQVLATAKKGEQGDELKRLAVIARIARASGYLGMIEGQMQDMAYENQQLTQEELEKMHGLKTGVLIRASIASGAILAGGKDLQLDHLDEYARSIGLAFQITDDILNVEGDPTIMGKAVGTDHLRSKSTYPSLLGLAPSKEYARQCIQKAIKALQSFDQQAEPLRAIARYVLDRQR